MNTTAETISNCISYANSTKEAVGFAVMVTEGEAIRRNIQDGKYEGISFPEPPKERKAREQTTEAHRIAVVNYVHELRHEGEKAREAAKIAGVSYQSYSRWRDDLDMPYEGACLRGQFN